MASGLGPGRCGRARGGGRLGPERRRAGRRVPPGGRVGAAGRRAEERSRRAARQSNVLAGGDLPGRGAHGAARDRKSTRLNSSHLVISYAVFCLKKKKK